MILTKYSLLSEIKQLIYIYLYYQLIFSTELNIKTQIKCLKYCNYVEI